MAATSIAVNDSYPANTLASGGEPALQIGGLPAELLKIEQTAVAEGADSQQALEATVRAIASLDTVCGVEVAVWHGGQFSPLASAGLAGLESRDKLAQMYVQCMESGRMLRCGGTALQASGLSCSFALLMPLFARGGAIGVLATFTHQFAVFTHDYIVPLATAAAICGALAKRIHEARADAPGMLMNDAHEAAVNDAHEAAVDAHRRGQVTLQVEPECFQLVSRGTESKVQFSASAPVEIEDGADSGEVSAATATGYQQGVRISNSFSKEDLRSVLLQGHPMLPQPSYASAPANSARLWNLVIVVTIVLALSGLVFGIVKLAN